MKLNSDQLKMFEQDGAIFPIKVLDETLLSHSRKGVMDVESVSEEMFPGLPFSHLFFSWARDLVTQPSVLDAVESLLGPELLVYATQLLIKPPRDPNFISWHQDGVSAGWYRWPAVAAWVALEDSTMENGCMQIVTGSHQGGRLPHGPAPLENNMLLNTDLVLSEIDESQVRSLVLKAGEMSLHHTSVVHGSLANRSDQKRVGFVIRFITPEYQYQHRKVPVFRVRGNKPCPHLHLWDQDLPDPAVAMDAWVAFQKNMRQSPVGK